MIRPAHRNRGGGTATGHPTGDDLHVMDANQMGRRNLENIDKVPLLERKREILAGQAKGRMEEGRNQHSPPVNLPQASDKTRDAVAAEIGVSNTRSGTRSAIISKLLRML